MGTQFFQDRTQGLIQINSHGKTNEKHSDMRVGNQYGNVCVGYTHPIFKVPSTTVRERQFTYGYLGDFHDRG